jgi:DNA polymerase III subunit gamma/tau
MSSLVLYRKYRPQNFSEIIGQEHIVKTITNAILGEMLSHAYLFSGPRGSGKTTIARILAKAANCQNRNGAEPCGKCSSCLEIAEGRALDLIEIDAASHRGIDEIRELREGIKFSPVKSKYKVFILDEAHQLSKDAANAILKTLEEPPSHAIFILATTEIQKMIPTIISRCQRFDFRKLTLAEIIKRLELVAGKEKIKIEKPAIELIALNSGGAIRDAESMLGQAMSFWQDSGKEIKAEDVKNMLGIADSSFASGFVDLLALKNTDGAFSFLNEAVGKGYDPQELVKAIIRYMRQVLILKIDPEAASSISFGFSKEEKERALSQAGKFQQAEIQRALNLFLEAENKMKYSSIPQLPIELAIVEITQPKE